MYRISQANFDYWVELLHSTRGWIILAVCPNLFTAEKIRTQLEA